MKRILILGASGFIGQKLVTTLNNIMDFKVTAVVRRHNLMLPVENIVLDVLDTDRLLAAIQDIDVVINCVAGDANTIVQSTISLIEAIKKNKNPVRLIHMSSMAVYGSATGHITENSPLNADIGWYAEAKIAAEKLLMDYKAQGGDVVILRPGCVYGSNSEQWVNRVCRLLASHRLGDLGAMGDGFSNLVHVDDVVNIISIIIRKQSLEFYIFNLAAQPNLRWNNYFSLLALALPATPLSRVTRRHLKIDTKIVSVFIKVCSIFFTKMGLKVKIPDPFPPSLLRLFSQQIYIDASLVESYLQVKWTPIEFGIKESVDSFLKSHNQH